MLNIKIIILLQFVFITTFSQISTTDLYKINNKGKFFFYHGWHESSYTNSDLHFKGKEFDFTLYNVKATDRVIPYALNPYLNPTGFTEVQTSTRIGYFFKENFTLSLGMDHLKYVMTNGQSVKINGNINAGTTYDKTFNNEDIILSKDFLEFEHTNGLNLLNIELNRFDNLFSILKIKSKHFNIGLFEGIGGGVLLPHTEVSLLNYKTFEEFNFAGFGLSLNAGINFTFFNHFFIQTELKGDYMNMPFARISDDKTEKVSQHFFAFQKVLVFGYNFKLWK